MSDRPVVLRLYRRVSAWLLPGDFSAQQGEHIVGLFEDLYRETRRERGAAAAARLCLREFRSLLRTAAREQAAQRGWNPRPLGTVDATRYGGGDRMKLIRTIWADTRLAGRLLRKNPTFAAVATLTLAIGIGATTAVFSVVNGVLLTPLPYPESDRLVTVWTRFLPQSGIDQTYFAISAREAFDYRDQSDSIEGIGLYITGRANLIDGEGDPEQLRAGMMTASVFSVLRATPLHGRALVEADGLPGAAGVVVLGHGLWRRRFGGDVGLIGQSISVNGTSREVVGIMGPGFAFPFGVAQLWIPARIDPADPGSRGEHEWVAVARLAPEVKLAEAEAELDVLMAGWKAEFGHHRYHFLWLNPLLDDLVAEVRPALLMVLGAVGFVLLIACANVASLLLARGEARRGEVAVRLALGAGRRRIAQQLLTESMVISIIGGTCGVALAVVTTRLLKLVHAGTVPRIEGVGVDGAMLAFAAAATFVTGIVFGIVPVLQAVGSRTRGVLPDGSRTSSGGRTRQRFRRGLVVCEIALSVMLVIGAGLMIRSVQALLSQDPGIDPSRTLVVQLALPPGSYSEEDAGRFFNRLSDELTSLPSVVSVSGTGAMPVSGSGTFRDFSIEGKAAPEGQQGTNARHVGVMARLFETLGIPLVRGRVFGEEDQADGPAVVVIDESFARRYFGDEDPIGQRLRWWGDNDDWATIVGVVGDVRYNGLAEDPGATYYYLHSQFPSLSLNVTVRTAAGPLAIVSQVRDVVRRMDRTVLISSARAMEELVQASVGESRFAMMLLSTFASVALLLGAVGVYGVTAYSVAQRRRELGIRMALGAAGRQLTAMVLRQGLLMAAAGIVLGVAGAAAATRVISGLLFNVRATDPVTFAVTIAVLGAVAFVATAVPARRATKVDPVTALRAD